jgi:hypothetical protein
MVRGPRRGVAGILTAAELAGPTPPISHVPPAVEPPQAGRRDHRHPPPARRFTSS